MYYALIMAGGVGSRLWPLSRPSCPKQTLQLVGDRTLFQHAVDRLRLLFDTERVHVVTREEYVPLLAEQVEALPQSNFVVEPEGRGTAPAIGLAALHLHRKAPDAVMAVLTADHFIADEAGFCRALEAAAEVAQRGHLVTLGIQPSFPSTGYGYIQRGASLGESNGLPVYRVDRFTEKPDLATAAEMVASGNYTWNSGMFIWRVDRILQEFERHMPAFHAQLMTLAGYTGTPNYTRQLAQIWPQVEKQTIDYGVMEQADDIAVLPVDIGWSDVGSWTSVADLHPSDADGNAFLSPHIAIDTHDTFVFGGKRLIATIGIKDVVIVDTGDALLVCAKDRVQDVREIAERGL